MPRLKQEVTMLTGKQRSYLKGLAMNMDTAVYIGKAELTDTVLKEMNDYLAAHEMVKVKVQEGSELSAKEAANAAAEKLGAQFVQAIGRRFVLYRPSEDQKIQLPR